MSKWTSSKLGELVSITRGTTYKSLLLNQPGPVLLGLASIQRNGGFRTDKLKTYGGDSPEKLLVRPGELFASLKDVTQSGDLLGSVARVPQLGPIGRLSQDTVRLDLISDRVDPDFLYLSLLTPVYRAWCRQHATGTTNLGLPRDDFLAYEVFHPISHNDQRRVAGVLNGIDDLIENSRRRVEVLEEMARTIYREWFVKFRYPGHANVPLVDSALGPIPSGWDIAPVSNMIEVNPRIKLDKSVEHPFIAMGDLDERTMSCRPSQVRTGGSGAKFMQGDTLFARITPCLENGKTGLVQRLAVGEVGLGSTEFIVLRGRAVGSAFTYCLARERDFRKHAIASMSGASGRQRVRNECFDTYLLPVPSRDVADAFESSMEAVFTQVAVLADEAEQLEHLRDLLLPKLVTGQIDVSTLDLRALVGDRVA